MGPELDPKVSSGITVEGSAGKENGTLVKEPDDQHMRCMSNYEDNMFEREALFVEGSEEMKRSEDVEVDIVGQKDLGDLALLDAKPQNSTDNSSSFGGSVSEVTDGAIINDAEVESGLNGDATSSLSFDGLGEVFRLRKKRLTAHWRMFIQPLMWRCKWAELQMKKFQSQAIKYSRELAQYDQKKQLGFEDSTVEDFGVKSLPFSSQSQSNEIMKRKKRKRVEDTLDAASHMSHHNLFSYDGRKRTAANGASMDDEWGKRVISVDKTRGSDQFGFNDELLPLEFRDDDNFLEQTLQKIDIVQSRVSKLRTRLDKVMSENACNDTLSFLVQCETSSAQNPASPPNDGDTMMVRSSYIASQLVSEYNKGDLVMPESAVSSHGEVSHLHDTIESTDHSQVAAQRQNTGDGILIYNRKAKEELVNFAEIEFEPVETTLQIPKEDQEESTTPSLSVPELDLTTDDQPALKVRSLSKLTAPKNKRKRARRKAGSSKWSRRSSG